MLMCPHCHSSTSISEWILEGSIYRHVKIEKGTIEYVSSECPEAYWITEAVCPICKTSFELPDPIMLEEGQEVFAIEEELKIELEYLKTREEVCHAR